MLQIATRKQSTSSPIAVETSRSTTQSDSIVRQTNKRSSCLSYTTVNNKHIFNDNPKVVPKKWPSKNIWLHLQVESVCRIFWQLTFLGLRELVFTFNHLYLKTQIFQYGFSIFFYSRSSHRDKGNGSAALRQIYRQEISTFTLLWISGHDAFSNGEVLVHIGSISVDSVQFKFWGMIIHFN